MNYAKNLLLSLFIFLLSGCAESIISVKPDSLDKIKDYNVINYYSLPKTELGIRIAVTQKIVNPGLLHKLDNKDVDQFFYKNYGWKKRTVDKTGSYQLEEKIIFRPITLSDPNKSFAIAYKKSKGIGQNFNITISKDGLIQSGEFAQESKVFEITKKSLELVGTFLGSALQLNPTSSPEDNTLKDILPENTSISERIKCLEKEIKELSNIRQTLLSTPVINVNTTVPIKFHLKEIDKRLTAIHSELCGPIDKKLHYFNFFIDPKKDFKEQLLLKISPTKIQYYDETCSWHLYPELISNTTNKPSTEKELKIVARRLDTPKGIRTATTAITQNENGQLQLNTNAFLYYNIPTKYELQLHYGGKLVPAFTSKDQKKGTDYYQIYFPQLGEVAFLPKDFSEANITYYEDTGALKNTTYKKEAEIDGTKVEQLYAAIDSVRKAVKIATSPKDTSEEEENTPEAAAEQVIRLIIQEENNSGSN